MLKNVLVILAEFFPVESSTTMCFLPLLRDMVSRGIGVDVITERQSDELSYEDTFEGTRVFRVDHKKELNASRRKKAILNSRGAGKLAAYFMSFVTRGAYRMAARVISHTEPRTFGWSKKKVAALACRLHEQNNYDLVISISLPFATHDMAYEFKKATGVAWLQLEYDPYYQNALFKDKLSDRTRRRKQIRCYEYCDAVVLTSELYNYYNDPGFDFYRFIDKMTAINYASMKRLPECEPDENTVRMGENHRILFYGGTFYKGIREPGPVLSVLKQVKEDYHLLVYSASKASLYAGLIDDFGQRITWNAAVEWEKVVSIMRAADILVSIGNTVPFQVPGKTFEYMASGKPIIHFSPCDRDTSLRYLRDYPMALIIDEKDDAAKSAARIGEFIDRYSGKNIGYDEIVELFPWLKSKRVCAEFMTIAERTAGKGNKTV